MTRDPRTIAPGEKSTFTIQMDDSGRPLQDVEISFEIQPKEAGSMESDKVKTDAKGCATGIFIASKSIDKDVDAFVKAKWKMGGQDKDCTMIVEVRPGLAKMK
ncbi:MAG: hypothetical protein QXT81_00505 [Candidatus Bathyarchaeia archaeon]